MLVNLKEEIADIKRLKQIINVLFKYELGYLVKSIKLKSLLPKHKRMMHHKFRKKSDNPEKMLYDFLESTYNAAAKSANCDRELLEKP